MGSLSPVLAPWGIDRMEGCRIRIRIIITIYDVSHEQGDCGYGFFYSLYDLIAQNIEGYIDI